MQDRVRGSPAVLCSPRWVVLLVAVGGGSLPEPAGVEIPRGVPLFCWFFFFFCGTAPSAASDGGSDTPPGGPSAAGAAPGHVALGGHLIYPPVTHVVRLQTPRAGGSLFKGRGGSVPTEAGLGAGGCLQGRGDGKGGRRLLRAEVDQVLLSG